jgi:hypothetical protein
MRKKKKNHKRQKAPPTEPARDCVACGTSLGIPGGMGGTDLCGPCCTGEAATLDEIGETW